MPYVGEISLCTLAQAAESATRHDLFHDYQPYRISTSIGGRVRLYLVAAVCDAHVLDHDDEFVSIFPLFFYSCFCPSNTTRSNRFQTSTHALGPPISGIKETINNAYMHVILYWSRRGPLSTLPRSLPVPRMNRFVFDVAPCSR